jgi:enoyl-CoA hydratase/carnithine racemase
MSPPVLVEIKNNIAHVRLNRPEKYNALDLDMFKAIIKAGEQICGDPTIRSVVLSGNGPGFCAGLDFKRFKDMADKGENRDASLLQRKNDAIANVAQQVGFIWKQVPVPVIAALHGVAFGGGFQIALGADIRLAEPDTRFSIMEIKWGIIPDMSITQTLRDLVRLDVAKELTYTGRIVEANEAAKLGLITRVCNSPLEEAEKLAEEIAGKSPHAVAAAKALYESAWHATREEGLLHEEILQRSLIGSPNQKEAVKSNLENRSPVYKDRT